MAVETKKTVLFFPLNSPGHVNSLLGLADRLKLTYEYKTVFLVLGPTMGTTIQDHGHDLILLEETTVHEDYEILDGEDTSIPVDEEEKKRLGLKKKKFPGCLKWPQIIARLEHIFTKETGQAITEIMRKADHLMLRELVDNYDKCERAISEIAPDLIVFDNYYTSPCIINNYKKVPWVKVFSANPMSIVGTPMPPLSRPPGQAGVRLLTKSKREKLRKEEPEKWTAMTDEWERINKLVFETAQNLGKETLKFLTDKGCPPLKPGQHSHESPYLNVYLFPKELDYDQDDDLFVYDKRWFRCDSLIRKPDSKVKEEIAEKWEKRLADAMVNKKEMVYFSLGTLASGNSRLMKPIIEILAKDQDRLYVISKGINGDRIQLNPSNMIGENYLPQTFFLERARLAIIHGGNNSITECLHYGVPVIVLPAFSDQFDNAQRIEDLELGRRVDLYKVDDSLLKVIEEVSSDEVLRDKLKKISSDISSRDEVNKVTLMLKKLVEEGRLDQEFIENCRNKSLKELQA